MRKVTKNILTALLVLITLDLTIVMIGLAQIAIEGRTGNWAPFWYAQAQFILKLLT